MTFYNSLREANLARQQVWDPKGLLTLDFKLAELLGEIGEVANLLKKKEREQLGLPGSRASTEHLAEELADATICLDLLLDRMDMQIPEQYYTLEPSGVAPTTHACAIGFYLGILSCTSPVLAERVTKPMTEEIQAEAAFTVYFLIAQIAADFAIDLRKAITEKFNRTSRQLDLNVFLNEDRETAGDKG
jgi:NTP pyrophosphatase (non-canonical NTP hydrolase)